jgi:hypothetical protein
MADSVFGGQAYTLPEAKGVRGYHDIAPRMGAAYDVFGNGKTAIKVTLAKYWQSASNDGNYQTANPASTFAQTTTHAWVDGNKNFVPDCNLLDRSRQDNQAAGDDLCGAWDNTNFGSIVTATTLNPEVLEGWGVRPFDWQFSAGVQQQLFSRVSAELSFSRRSWGNFFFTDNRAIGPEDFDVLTFTPPASQGPELPASGQPRRYMLLKESAFGKSNNYYTFASDYGDVDYHWQGIDLSPHRTDRRWRRITTSPPHKCSRSSAGRLPAAGRTRRSICCCPGSSTRIGSTRSTCASPRFCGSGERAARSASISTTCSTRTPERPSTRRSARMAGRGCAKRQF